MHQPESKAFPGEPQVKPGPGPPRQHGEGPTWHGIYSPPSLTHTHTLHCCTSSLPVQLVCSDKFQCLGEGKKPLREGRQWFGHPFPCRRGPGLFCLGKQAGVDSQIKKGAGAEAPLGVLPSGPSAKNRGRQPQGGRLKTKTSRRISRTWSAQGMPASRKEGQLHTWDR